MSPAALPFDLLLVQGRIADRTPGALPGAALAAAALAERTGVKPMTVGAPSPPLHDDWSESLPLAAETLADLSAAVAVVLKRGRIPFLVANTCSASLATLSVLAAERPEATVLWIDAHGDFNTPATTSSGYLGGMVLAGACGLWDSGHGGGLDPRRVVVVGARDVDGEEGRLHR